MCAVDQKRPFFLRAGPCLAFLPFKEAYGKAGPLREAPYGEGRSLREGPPYGEGRSLRKGPLTGSPFRGWLPLQKRTAYGKLRGKILPELGGNFRLCAVDQKRPFFLRAGPFLAFLPFKDAYGKAEGRSLREGPPYGKGPLTGSPLRGWLPLQKRTAYGKLRGKILPELGGNFRLCAVDQKRPFFLRAGPFLAFLPFKEAYGKAGPLREAPCGEGRSLREGPLRRGTVLTGRAPLRGVPYGDGSLYKKGRLLEATGRDFTRIGRELPLVAL